MTMTKTLATVLVAYLLLAGSALAQTCNNHILAVAPDSRYANHGNGTVTDTATGLMWKQCSEGLSGPDCGSGSPQNFVWQGALRHGQGHTFAGYSDWRLPNINELASLVEERCSEPAINVTLFPNTPSWFFWSSSPFAYYPENTWLVGFSHGYYLDAGRDFGYFVRLVRGGQ